jgi:predicted nucleotidyltransferase
MEKTLEAPLRKALVFLEGNGYSYAIIGGIALAQWGVVRATLDVDIKVLVPDNDYTKMRAALRSEFPITARQELDTHPLIVAVDIDGVNVDFLLALPGYEENIIQRAVQRDMNGWKAWICSVEDLIIQKAIAGRGKDWLDIEALLIERHGHLDQAYIHDWLSEFVEALDDPDLFVKYKHLVQQVETLF